MDGAASQKNSIQPDGGNAPTGVVEAPQDLEAFLRPCEAEHRKRHRIISLTGANTDIYAVPKDCLQENEGEDEAAVDPAELEEDIPSDKEDSNMEDSDAEENTPIYMSRKRMKRKATVAGSDDGQASPKRSCCRATVECPQEEQLSDNEEGEDEDEDEDEEEYLEDQAGENSADDLVQSIGKPIASTNNAQRAAENGKDDLRKCQFRTIYRKCRTTLEDSGGAQTIRELLDILHMVDIMNEKYIQATEKKKTRREKPPHPQLKEEFEKRLKGKEELLHPWGTPSKPKEIPGLLIRAWDQISQCRIDNQRVGFLSGGSDSFLNTKEKRKQALMHHANWGNRNKTPFISFSSSLREIAKFRVPHFQNRQASLGIVENTRLTIINTNAIIAAGKPILKMKDELLHYDIRPPKTGDLRYNSTSFYENEYIVPFSVAKDAIVRTCTWHDIEKWMRKNNAEIEDWYVQEGIPSFKEHERVRLGGTPLPCKAGCDCCGQ